MFQNIVLIIVLIIIIIFILLIIGGIYFYNTSILRRKKDFMQNAPDLPPDPSGDTWSKGRKWLEDMPCYRLNIKSEDGLSLCAHYLPYSERSNKTVILVHGYTSKGRDMGAFAKFYYEGLGFNVLMPDCRGHGESEGNYIGFGWHDRKDILNWINYIIKEDGIDSQIVLHGVSMGGATVLMTGGESLPDNVKCIISDCAYNSITGILAYQMKRMYKIPKFPLIYVTSLVSRMRAGYYFREASAIKQVEACGVPILFIHGSEDRFVPTQMVYQLYEAAKCEKQLFLVEGAGHGNAFWTDPEGYKKHVSEFLRRYVMY